MERETTTCDCWECGIEKDACEFSDACDELICNACYPRVQAAREAKEVARLVARAAVLGCSVQLLKVIEDLEFKVQLLRGEWTK